MTDSPEAPPLAISTLRGQFADNREWSADPCRPAVIVGTVDMIGSRLLFSGYRCGFKSRPLHASFLGQDALLVHDEAHLEPAFQKLIEAIVQEQQNERNRGANSPWRGLRVMALSATARGDNGNAHAEKCKPFELTAEEKHPPDVIPDPPTKPIHHVWRRLKAKKVLRLHESSDGKDAVAREIAERAADKKDCGAAVLVFVRTLDDIDTVEKELRKTQRPVVLVTGTMRGLERDELVETDHFKRFLKDASSGETVYLVCTSAGEVGIDLSADHMVCDLSTFESMAQRLGRVNRYGDGDARIDVVYPAKFDEKDKLSPARKNTLKLFQQLPQLPQSEEQSGVTRYDASPKALGELRVRTDLPCKIDDAFSPEPTMLDVTDILFDAWAMTTIRDKMPGRPPVAPYLHGVVEWEPPRTSIAWRADVEYITNDLIDRYGSDLPQSLLDDYPLKPHELLNDTSERVFKVLQALTKHLDDDCPIWLVGERGDVEVTRLKKLLAPDKKQVIERIADCTILLPPQVGSLTALGTLDGEAKHDAKHPHGYDVADCWVGEDGKPRRQRLFSDDRQPTNGPEDMALIRTIDTNPDAGEFEPPEDEAGAEVGGEMEESAPLKQDRYWHWYARPRDAEDATRASTRPISWKHHTDDVVERTKKLVKSLNLPDDLKQAAILAAELHDLGKQRELWQRSIGNPDPNGPPWYAKPGKPLNGPRWQPRYLSPYRHEFGSLLDVLDTTQEHFTKLEAVSGDMHDVVLHLIAAHHGYARPHFSPETTVDPSPPRKVDADDVAVEAVRRFARLQRRFGRWGLAYLESLLRAADWAASADPSHNGDNA